MMLSPSVRFLSFRAISAVLACCVLLMAPACLTAADGDQENKISFMIISADRLLDDVEYMVDDLADRKKIWNEKIAESIELFLEGVDRKKPVRIDMFFDQETGEYYRPFFPITSVAAFRNNVDSFGIAQKPIARDVYSLSNAFEGFMKISKDYALFAPEGLRNIIDPKPPEVLPTVSPLIDRDFDAGVIIRHDATGMEVRRGSLAEIRKNVISGIKKKSTESVEEFEYRKLLALNRLKQFEDLYAEVATLDAGWVTDQEKKNGVGTLLVSGIEGTTVDKTIRSIADQKTRFHVMSPSEKSMGFGTMLYPLDERVQERLTKTLSAYEQVAGIKIDRKEDLKPAQKTAAKQAVGKTIKILNDGIALGVLDGFFDARRIRHEDANSAHEMVAGLRASAGRDIEEVLDLLPQIRETFKVRKDIEVVKDFHLHEVVLETNVPPMLNSLFGTPCHIFLATSEKMVFFSVGENSLGWLKEAITTVTDKTEEVTPENFFTLKGHVGPLAKALSAREANDDEKIKQYREAVIEAFSPPYSDDYLEMRNKLVDNKIDGYMEVEAGVLRLLGILVANFADENL